MAVRSAELANLPQQSTEDVRLYGRKADEVLATIGTDVEFRAHELRGRVVALLKYAKSRGVTTGQNGFVSDFNMRAARVVLGYIEAAVAIRLARHGVRIVYKALEKHCGAELAALRQEKYGAKTPNQPNKLEV